MYQQKCLSNAMKDRAITDSAGTVLVNVGYLDLNIKHINWIASRTRNLHIHTGSACVSTRSKMYSQRHCLLHCPFPVMRFYAQCPIPPFPSSLPIHSFFFIANTLPFLSLLPSFRDTIGKNSKTAQNLTKTSLLVHPFSPFLVAHCLIITFV